MRKIGGRSVRWTVAPVDSVLTPKRKVIQIAVLNPVHCRRVRRRNLLAKGCPPCGCHLMITHLFNTKSQTIRFLTFFNFFYKENSYEKLS
ncbi:MAG: hypothetical protein LBK82_08135 [Planctomycetaceae bacterium]|nr:hypothetical protein [Planctomycetaceae bacterium]